MNQKNYANEKLLDVSCSLRHVSGLLPDIVKMSDTEALHIAISELSSLGRMLIQELHSRGRMYSDV